MQLLQSLTSFLFLNPLVARSGATAFHSAPQVNPISNHFLDSKSMRLPHSGSNRLVLSQKMTLRGDERKAAMIRRKS